MTYRIRQADEGRFEVLVVREVWVAGFADLADAEMYVRIKAPEGAIRTETARRETGRLDEVGRKIQEVRLAAEAIDGADERACRVCGCTWTRACETVDGGCHWAEDDLCSACDAAGAIMAAHGRAVAAEAELDEREGAPVEVPAPEPDEPAPAPIEEAAGDDAEPEPVCTVPMPDRDAASLPTAPVPPSLAVSHPRSGPAPRPKADARAADRVFSAEELDEAFGRIAAGEGLKAVADSMKKSWLTLRSRWAQHKQEQARSGKAWPRSVPCLSCRKSFMSPGPQVRMCGACRYKSE